jgi:multidrug efflux pump subunit AcrA (membrane-fusion protein)
MSAILERTTENLQKTNSGRWTTIAPPVVSSRSQAGRLSAVQRSPKPARKGWPWLATAVVAAVATLGIYELQRILRAESALSTDHAEMLTTVKVATPAPATSASVVLPATIRPWQTTTLHARVSGYLTAWHGEIGSAVKAGDLLAEIETPELDQELLEGEALASEAAAAVVQAKAERAEARADLKVAEAQLVRIQAETELAKSQLARREKLLATKAIARDDYETFATQVEARTAEVDAARADVVRRRTNLETRGAIIAVREATAKSRRASFERQKELQVFKRIVAPFDGVVTRRAAEVGMLVTAGKESLFTIEDMSRVRVQVSVPQTYALQTAAGSHATVSVPESTLPAVDGTITRTAESIESTNRTMLSEIELVNSSHRYQPGSYAQVTVSTTQDKTAWTVPSNTIHMRVDGPHVAVVNEQNRVENRHVVLGRDLGNRVVVAEGIHGDERLVINPGDSLVDGARIRISRDEPAGAVAKR